MLLLWPKFDDKLLPDILVSKPRWQLSFKQDYDQPFFHSGIVKQNWKRTHEQAQNHLPRGNVVDVSGQLSPTHSGKTYNA